jgi:hypothetical protein
MKNRPLFCYSLVALLNATERPQGGPAWQAPTFQTFAVDEFRAGVCPPEFRKSQSDADCLGREAIGGLSV